MPEPLNVPYRSIPDMFLHRVAATPEARAFASPGADGPVWVTWKQTADHAVAIAAGLHSLGVQPEDAVAIAASTRVEWIYADLGIMCAGAATTTIYPTTDAPDAAFILTDSGSKVLIAENPGQVTKLAGHPLPGLTHIVLIDGSVADAPAPVPVLTLADLEAKGHNLLAEDPELVTRIAAGVAPHHLATLMYTSGTTGKPKGVELLHGGWCWEGVAQGALGVMAPDDLQYLWLPLSHSFGKTIICGVIHVGVPTYVDGRVDKIAATLPTVAPTMMCGAPRIYEKLYNGINGAMRSQGGVTYRIFKWAIKVGTEVYQLELKGKTPGSGLARRHRLADKLVFSKIRARLGGRIRILVSGAAPLNKDIQEFFHVTGLNIYEGYGLTETSAGSFVNTEKEFRFGTVGHPLAADLEVKIAEDGEILLRGVPVMRGYHNQPEATAEAFTEDHFFKTGDIGEIDADGYLRITDRKKDLIKTSGGKYIAPSHLEGQFKALCPYVSQVVIVGQARNFVTMLVTLDPDALPGWVAGTPLEGRSYAEISASPQAQDMIEGYVKQLNATLNRWETIKKFTILSRDLSIESGELTPSLKVKRRAVETAFSDDIEKMYVGAIAGD